MAVYDATLLSVPILFIIMGAALIDKFEAKGVQKRLGQLAWGIGIIILLLSVIFNLIGHEYCEGVLISGAIILFLGLLILSPIGDMVRLYLTYKSEKIEE